MKNEEQGPAPSNAFMQVLQTHDGGDVCNELADAMREATAAVVLSGKASTASSTPISPSTIRRCTSTKP